MFRNWDSIDNPLPFRNEELGRIDRRRFPRRREGNRNEKNQSKAYYVKIITFLRERLTGDGRDENF